MLVLYDFGESMYQFWEIGTLISVDRKEIARRRTLAVIEILKETIDDDDRVNRTDAAAAVGIAPSTFYRWLDTPPQKIDLVQIVALADYLHDVYGYENFAALWRRVERDIVE